MYYSGETKILKANCIKYRPHLELLRVWRGLNGVTSAELRDSRNSLLYGVPESLLRKIQSVQDATARLVTSTRRRDHITPVLGRLHRLPVQRRVEFKTVCLVRQSLVQRRRRTCLSPHSTRLRIWLFQYSLIFQQHTGCSTAAHQFR